MFRYFSKLVLVSGILMIGGGLLLMTMTPRQGNEMIDSRSLWFDEAQVSDIDSLHMKRRIHARQACDLLPTRYNLTKLLRDPENFDNVYVDDENQFLFCSVAKVACTNWKRALLSLRGFEDTDRIKTDDLYDKEGKYYSTLREMRLSEYSKKEIMWRLNNYQKFLFVREPFERILSAWRNKFVMGKNPYFRKHFASYIIERYRQDNSGDDESRAVTFPEFVRFLLNPQTKEDEMDNGHWNTYESLCFPCIMDFDYIGKYETMDQDIAYITRRLHIEDLKFPERDIKYKYSPTADIAQREYSKIPVNEIREIYESYKSDFAVFNYPNKNFRGEPGEWA